MLPCFYASLHHKHYNEHPRRGVRKNPTAPAVKRLFFSERKIKRFFAGDKDFFTIFVPDLSQDLAISGNKRRDAGIGSTNHRNPVFDGAQNRSVQMLIRRRSLAEPRIIRDHHDEISAKVGSTA